MRVSLRPLVLVLGVLVASATAEAQRELSPVRPTGVWAGFQLLPASDLLIDERQLRGGLHWQVTPVLYSWSRDRRVGPWRFLVAEPMVRHDGSLELVAVPGIVLGGTPSASFRALTRVTFSLAEHGERASLSLGGGYGRVFRRDVAVVEAGLYVLFGIVGVRAAWMPAPGALRTFVLSFQARYF